FVRIVCMLVIAGILDAFAAAILAALASIIGAEAAPEIEAMACEFAESANATLTSMSAAMTVVEHTYAAAITAGIAGDVLGQLLSGNDEVLGDLKQSVIDGFDNVLRGSLSRLERDLTAKAVGTGFEPFVAKGLFDTFHGNPALTDEYTNPDLVH